MSGGVSGLIIQVSEPIQPSRCIIALAYFKARHRVMEQQIPSLRFGVIARMRFEG